MLNIKNYLTLVLGDIMTRHYEKAEGLCENIDQETQSYIFNQTMMRIKDPIVSLDFYTCLLYTSPSPRDGLLSRMPSSA